MVIVGYLVDESDNKGFALLNTLSFVNEGEYSSVIGKSLIACGTYEGYSATERMPIIYVNKLAVKETGEIKSGILLMKIKT